MPINVEALLAPIPGDHPSGTNIREDSAAQPLYYKLKDARAAAREAERRADSDPDAVALPPEWRQVQALAVEILETRSKDLEVAAWLTEASLRIDGFAGLRDSLAVTHGLVDRFWASLYSLDEEDVGAKVAPLAGLNGRANEGSLIQPLRLAPITAPATGEAAGLWHYLVMRKRGANVREATILRAAVEGTSVADFKTLFTDMAAAAASFVDLTSRLDTLCGEDTPPSSAIYNTLIEAQEALRDVSGLGIDLLTGDPVMSPQVAQPAAAVMAMAPAAPAPAPSGPAVLENREDALRELARVATFFREHEPNSLTAYALQTLIRRARLPLRELLTELIPDEAVRRGYLIAAGIGQDGPTLP